VSEKEGESRLPPESCSGGVCSFATAVTPGEWADVRSNLSEDYERPVSTSAERSIGCSRWLKGHAALALIVMNLTAKNKEDATNAKCSLPL